MKRDDLYDLAAFAVVAEQGSFTCAAAELGMSQSALSLGSVSVGIVDDDVLRVALAKLVPFLVRVDVEVEVLEGGEVLRHLVGRSLGGRVLATGERCGEENSSGKREQRFHGYLRKKEPTLYASPRDFPADSGHLGFERVERAGRVHERGACVHLDGDAERLDHLVVGHIEPVTADPTMAQPASADHWPCQTGVGIAAATSRLGKVTGCRLPIPRSIVSATQGFERRPGVRASARPSFRQSNLIAFCMSRWWGNSPRSQRS